MLVWLINKKCYIFGYHEKATKNQINLAADGNRPAFGLGLG